MRASVSSSIGSNASARALGIGVATVELVADISLSGGAPRMKTAADIRLRLPSEVREHLARAGTADGFAHQM
jgi:hypothetical protein